MTKKHTKLATQLVLSIMRFDETIDDTLDEYPYITMSYILTLIEDFSRDFFAAQRRRA